MKIMGVEVELVRSELDDMNVQYDLFKAVEKGLGFVRVMDTDVQEVIQIKRYPDFNKAEEAFTEMLSKVQGLILSEPKKGSRTATAPENVPQEWTEELQMNRHLVKPAFDTSVLWKEVDSFLEKIASISESIPAETGSQMRTLLDKIVYDTLTPMFETMQEYDPATQERLKTQYSHTQKLLKAFIISKKRKSYLHIIAKIFTPEWADLVRHMQATAKTILDGVVASRSKVPQKRYQKIKDHITTLFTQLKELLTLSNS